MITIRNKTWALLSIALLFVLLAAFTMLTRSVMPREALAAGDTGNYSVFSAMAGDTAVVSTTETALAAWDAAEYGSVVIQVSREATPTTATLTIVPQYSNQVNLPCSAVTSWFTGTDWLDDRPQSIVYSYGASLGSLYYLTSTAPYTAEVTYPPYTATYRYGDVTGVQQSLSVATGAPAAKEFEVQGRCMRLLVSTDETVTPTIYVMLRDHLK